MIVNATNVLHVQALLNEYGAAMRGSWANIDGRSVRDDMEDLAMVLTHERDIDLVDYRQRLGICPHGLGHWTDFCDEDCVTGGAFYGT